MIPLRENPFFKDALDKVGRESELKGRAEGRKEAILDLLSFKGFAVSDAVRRAVMEANADMIGQMLRSAVAAETIDRFIDALDAMSSKTA